jgi:hypothetical protein
VAATHFLQVRRRLVRRLCDEIAGPVLQGVGRGDQPRRVVGGDAFPELCQQARRFLQEHRRRLGQEPSITIHPRQRGGCVHAVRRCAGRRFFMADPAAHENASVDGLPELIFLDRLAK